MRAWLLIVATLFPALAAAQQWYLVEAEDQPITVAASGIVASADALRFGPPPNRRWRIAITQLAQEGSRVRAGDVLARFESERRVLAMMNHPGIAAILEAGFLLEDRELLTDRADVVAVCDVDAAKAKAGTTMATHRVDLIHKYDAGGILFALIEEIPDP